MTVNKIDAFEEELAFIEDENVRNWVTECLAVTPDYFFDCSASESYRHHPYWDLGPQGCLRHSKAVTVIANRLLGTLVIGDDSKAKLLRSRVLAACILHDSAKYGITFDLRTYDAHPYLPRILFKKVWGSMEPTDREWIFKAIDSHMGSVATGEWSMLPYVTVNNLKDPLMAVVHHADYIASNKDYVDLRFEGVNKDIVLNIDTAPYYDPFPDAVLSGLILGEIENKVGKDKLAEILTSSDYDSVKCILSRVQSLRTPYYRRCEEYNINGIMSCVKDNVEKFFSGI